MADEAALVKRCKAGDPAAQKALYCSYAGDMLLLCLRYIIDPEDARETLMDGFLSFFNNIGSFTWRGDGSVKAWLKKIVINHCLMYLRRHNAACMVDMEAAQYEAADTGENILGQLNAKEILKLVHSLPDGYRLVFNLYVFEEKTHKEIAALLGIAEGTSKSQLMRARALLKKQIVEIS